MTLGRKTLVLFLALGAAICVGSYLALRLTVLPAFAEFERNASEEALGRVTRMLESDLRALKIMNIEYSSWNDTHAYAFGNYPDFAAENLDPSYWHSVNINAMLIFDQDGKALFARIGDPSDGQRLEFTDQFVATLRPDHPLVTHLSPSSSLSGLIATEVGIMQVTSHPILTGDGKGPIAGTFIVGKFLSDQRVAELGERATVALSIRSVDDETLPAAAAALINKTDAADSAVVTSADNVHGYQLLQGISGEPIAVLEVRQPRAITQIGLKTIRAAMTFLVFGSIGFLLAALFSLQRLIVAPIHKLTEKILNIQSTGNLEMDIESRRSDEIGVLAGKFAELTSGLSKARDELERARDDAISLSEAKSEFLARMSHEIRTPMNGVLGMTELLRNTSLTERQERFADTIYESAESLLHIINDILDISRIEAGKLELDVAPFNLRNVAEECLDLLADSAHRKELELVGIIPPEMHTAVEGDALRLRQIVINLLSNAVKFTQQGEVILRVNVLKEAEDQLQYRIEVQDSGIGIRQDNLEKIFDPFTQEDGSTTRQFGGTGLGLSICRQLVELMDGEIGVESRPGGGCTFWFTLTLRRLNEPSQPYNPEMLSGKRVLIVDDNLTNREALQQQLESWHMKVTSASSAAEALGVISTSLRENKPYEALLLDMNMPEMNGIELAKEISDTDGFRNAPLLMLSSVSLGDTNFSHAESAVDAWLTKPVRQARLCDALMSHLSRSKGLAESASDRQPSASAGDDRELQCLRVLLAEDNEVNKMVAQSMLVELGHQAVVASNGQEAVDTFKDHDFDIVLMDCQMPVVDGFEATRGIRDWEREQQLDPTAIVALTANALAGDRERCLDAGMNDYLSKPFSSDQLAEVLADNVVKTEPAANDIFCSGAKILVVDDNAINQQVTCAMLQDLGFVADVAANGNEALRAIEASDYKLVFMDCHMPLKDGYETTAEIRRREKAPGTATRLSVVALTADLMQGNRERCLECGMDDYIPKPFTLAQLQQVVDRWLPGGTAVNSATPTDADGFSELTDSMPLSSLDRDTFDEILQLDSSATKHVARDIILSYCALSTRLMLQLRAAIKDVDHDEIQLLAHSLKGCSAQVGAIELASLCEKILHAAHDNDLSEAPALCERAATEHSAIIIALDKEIRRIAA